MKETLSDTNVEPLFPMLPNLRVVYLVSSQQCPCSDLQTWAMEKTVAGFLQIAERFYLRTLNRGPARGS